jgi:hypothetical protein
LKADYEERIQNFQHTVDEQSDAIDALAVPVVYLDETSIMLPLDDTLTAQRAEQIWRQVIEPATANGGKVRTVFLDLHRVTECRPDVVALLRNLYGTPARVLLTGVNETCQEDLVAAGASLASMQAALIGLAKTTPHFQPLRCHALAS